MRQDQYEKLQALEEKLLDVFIVEADPSSWPGQGIKLSEMDSKTRGDLYWCRKTAASTCVLVQRVAGLIGQTQAGGRGTAPADDDPAVDPATETANAERQLDDEIARAERDAERLIREVQTGSKKAAFDKRTHGRA